MTLTEQREALVAERAALDARIAQVNAEIYRANRKASRQAAYSLFAAACDRCEEPHPSVRPVRVGGEPTNELMCRACFCWYVVGRRTDVRPDDFAGWT